jgi:hypothetical protein
VRKGAHLFRHSLFVTKHYRCCSGHAPCPLKLSRAQDDYDVGRREVRRRLRLTRVRWPSELVQREKPSSISGNRGSGRRHPSYGDVYSNLSASVARREFGGFLAYSGS